MLIEVEVSDLQWVPGASEEVLKLLIFFCSHLKLLSIQCSSELGGLNGSLSEWVMILEEFTNSNSVSHDMILDLSHKWFHVFSTSEINVEVNIGRFGT